MELPEKPFNWEKEFKKGPEKILQSTGENKLFQKAVEYNKRYLYWTELKYRVKNTTEQKQLWTVMKLLRSSKYEKIKFANLQLQYYLLSDFAEKLHIFDKYLTGNIEIKQEKLNLEKRYIISSLMEEAIASSMIEGAATTRKIAKSMLREKRKPKNKSERMIVNNYETMRYVFGKKNEKLTPEIILEIQRMVTKRTLEDSGDEGRFRDTNDIVVGDSTYAEIIAHTPPDFQKIPELITAFCNFANNDEKEFIHPILKAITLHFLLGYIHPFNDGNGRTARSIFYWYMLSKEYWLFEYMAVSRRILRSKKNYDLAYLYTEYDEMDLTYFFKYNIECISDALQDMLEHIRKKQREQAEAKKRIYENPTLNLRQAIILEELTKNPNKPFSIKEVAETYRVVYQTARTDLLLLEKQGFLTKKKVGKALLFILKE